MTGWHSNSKQFFCRGIYVLVSRTLWGLHWRSVLMCCVYFCNKLPYTIFQLVIWITFFFMTGEPLVGLDLVIIEASRTHSETSHSVGLLWTSDRPDVESSTWRHTTLTTDRHPYHRPSQRAAAYQCLRPTKHRLNLPYFGRTYLSLI